MVRLSRGKEPTMAIQYFVDESKRICVAKLVFEDEDGEPLTPLEDAENYICAKLEREAASSASRIERDLTFAYTVVVKAVLHQMGVPQFVAKAECAPEDTFDEVVGCDLARARLLRKYYKWLTDCTETVQYKLEDMIQLAQKTSYKAWHLMKRWDDEVLELE